MLIPFPIWICLTALNLGQRKAHSTDEWKIIVYQKIICTSVCGTDHSEIDSIILTSILSVVWNSGKNNIFFFPVTLH